MLVITGCRDYLLTIFQSSKLTKILHFAPEKAAAMQLFDAAKRKREEAALRAAEAARKAAEPVMPAPPQRKKFIPCWEYWNNRNPRNATTCEECFHRQNPKGRPCWIIDGDVEGVTFQFVNESCADCRYFEEFGKVPQEQLG
jgi:hypothetical protein